VRKKKKIKREGRKAASKRNEGDNMVCEVKKMKG